MKCLKIMVNDERCYVAGAEGAAVFAFIWLDPAARGRMSLSVQGRSTDLATVYEWGEEARHVAMGDVVTSA